MRIRAEEAERKIEVLTIQFEEARKRAAGWQSKAMSKVPQAAPTSEGVQTLRELVGDGWSTRRCAECLGLGLSTAREIRSKLKI